MKKFTICLLVSIFIFAGCNYQNKASLNTKNIGVGIVNSEQNQNSPKEASQQEVNYFNLQSKCTELGQVYADKNLKDFKNSFSSITLDGPFFHYSKKLQTCFIEYKATLYDTSSLTDPNNYIVQNYIVDLFSGNENLITYSWKNGSFKGSFDEKEYERFQSLEMDLMQN